MVSQHYPLHASDIVVKVLPLSNGNREFILQRECHVTYWTRDGARSFVVPAGFQTNFTSSPRIAWSVVAPLDICYASLVHDYLYSIQGHALYALSRKEADKVLRSIIAITHSRFLAMMCYLSVRAAGSRYFLKEPRPNTPSRRVFFC